VSSSSKEPATNRLYLKGFIISVNIIVLKLKIFVLSIANNVVVSELNRIWHFQRKNINKHFWGEGTTLPSGEVEYFPHPTSISP